MAKGADVGVLVGATVGVPVGTVVEADSLGVVDGDEDGGIWATEGGIVGEDVGNSVGGVVLVTTVSLILSVVEPLLSLVGVGAKVDEKFAKGNDVGRKEVRVARSGVGA